MGQGNKIGAGQLNLSGGKSSKLVEGVASFDANGLAVPATTDFADSSNPDWNGSLYIPKKVLTQDGDLLIRANGALTRVPIGTVAQVLTVSPSRLPSWAAASGGGGGGLVSPFYIVYTDSASNDVTIDPNSSTTDGTTGIYVPDSASGHNPGLHCTIDAGYAGKTILVSFEVFWTTEHNLHIGATLDTTSGTFIHADNTYSAVAADGKYESRLAEFVYTLPNDGAAHTIHIFVNDAGSTGNITFKNRTLTVKVLSGLTGGGPAIDWVKIYRNAAFTLTGDLVGHIFPFDTMDFDGNTLADLGNNGIKIKKAGIYQASWQLYQDPPMRFTSVLTVNGGNILHGSDVNNDYSTVGSGLIQVAINDIVRVNYIAGAAHAIVTGQNPAINFLSLAKVG